ncbi:MAG: S9 family peptidase, partial [Candidatus Marinimicrobia bacterium]|nr:S9 family peptidase [Candidatus Neomarinimicrobiota bacterium]
MKLNKLVLVVSVFFLVLSCINNNKNKIVYPYTKTVAQEDDYHGTIVKDPYRWLEDMDSEEVKDWIFEQQKLTESYIDQIPQIVEIENKLKERWNYPRMSLPFHRNNRYFFYKNSGLQNHSVLYYKDGLNGEEKILLDPNILSEDGSLSISMVSVSKDGKLLAYGVSKSGSDWDEYFVKDIDTGENFTDHLKWIKFSKAYWLPDGSGFFYSRYPEPLEGDEFKNQNQFNKLYLHRIGTEQSKDSLIYEDSSNPDYGFYSWVTDDEQYQILGVWSGSNNNNLLYYKKKGSKEKFQPIIDEWIGDFRLIHNFGSEFYIQTTFNSPKGRIIKIDINDPSQKNWKNIVNENENTLHSSKVVNTNQILITYKKDLIHNLHLHDINGEYIDKVSLPSKGSLRISANWDDSEIFYSFTSFLYPTTIFKLNLNSGLSDLFWEADINFDNNQYTVDQIFYDSKDGTQIPMFIIHNNKIKKNSLNPTYLYGYGGFNAGLTPYFSLSRLSWLELGGIIALPGIRGGNEYGEDWHKGGMLGNKQNVFDDFISAASYLIDEKYTNPNKLAIGGGSNGGLLVSACALQQPDLFRVVDCSVPVADMLRYHKFTIGWAWIPEYGSSDDPEQFQVLFNYSPVHNVKKGIKYPSMLISTADHDDRVVPLHSYKLAATLQAKQNGKNPILLQVHSKSGHGAGKPTEKIIKEIA